MNKKMSEIFVWWDYKKKYTSAKIRKIQKQMKKSYKKADIIKKEYEQIHKKEKEEAEKLLDDL